MNPEFIVLQRFVKRIDTKIEDLKHIILYSNVEDYMTYRSLRGRLLELEMLKQDFQDLLKKGTADDETANT